MTNNKGGDTMKWRVIIWGNVKGVYDDKPIMTSRAYETEEEAQAMADFIDEQWRVDYNHVKITVQGFYE